MKLTAAVLETIETPASGQKKRYDGRGMYLLISHTGARAWRFKYRFGGKEQLLSLGKYPTVGLFAAREAAKVARELLQQGINPSTVRKEERAARQEAAEDTFGKIVLEYLSLDDSLAPRTQRKNMWSYQLVSTMHSTPISRLTTPQIVQTLKAIEGPGTTRRESAHRARSLVSRVCRYAVQTGRLATNPSVDLAGALKPIRRTSFPAITEPRTFGLLLRVIDMYEGSPSVANALKLAPHLALRPGELRSLEWANVNFERAEIVLPAHKMKTRRIHVVPLSRQALAILKTQHALSGNTKYCFTGPRTLRPVSDMTLTMAMHNISPAFGREDQSMHGWRASFSTLLHELGFESDLIERQLAHVQSSKVAAAYNRGTRLEARRGMMQAWSDYIDELRTAAC